MADPTETTPENQAPTIADLGTVEPKPETKVTKVQATRPAPPPAAPSEPVAPKPLSFTDTISQFKTKGTPNQKALIVALEKYIEVMAPGVPVTGENGARHQYTLWRTIYNIVHNIPITEFKATWQLLLLYFNEYQATVFHERYVFRFSEYWVHTQDELNGFQRIVNLLKLTCVPASREIGLKQVNINATLSQGFTEDARQRILSFYL